MSSTKNRNINFKTIMSSPITIILSVVLGVVVGIFVGKIRIIEIFAELYINVLQMCVIPIVCGAICVNIGELVSKHFRPLLKKLLLAAIVTLVFSSSAGAIGGYALKEFLVPNLEMTTELSKLQSGDDNDSIEFIEISYYSSDTDDSEEETKYSVADFILNVIPDNIFEAFTEGQMLKIIFFFSILGIMLKFISEDAARPVLKAMEGIYQVFVKFVNFLLGFLPIGLFAILENQFSEEGMEEILRPLIRLIIAIYIVCFVIIIASFIIVQLKTGCTVKEHIKAVSRTFFLCIGTSSCIASLAVAIEDSVNYFKLNDKVTKSFMPIGITMIQSGVIAANSLVCVFAAILYDVPLTFNAMLIIIVGSIFYGFSVIGVPGLVAATMMSIVLDPLGIPSSVIAVLLIAIVMFFDPIAVFSSVYSNIGIATCIIPKEEK